MDYLDKLAQSTQNTIKEGYYNHTKRLVVERKSLVNTIHNCKKEETVPIIAEIKRSTPQGIIREDINVEEMVDLYKTGGAIGISVLTEPKYFKGSLNDLKVAVRSGLPILMKDFILHPIQIRAGSDLGASAILLIGSLFEREYTMESLDEMIKIAHEEGLEVLLEVNSVVEYEKALETRADLIGINNRNLGTLKVDLDTTKKVLQHVGKDRPIVSMSGISSPQHIQMLRRMGADAFLIGTSIIKSNNISMKLKTLVGVK